MNSTGRTVRSTGGRRVNLALLIAAAGNAFTSSPLSQFAATTSAQLAGVISDETGSGALVFATSPTLVTPILGTPASGALGSCTNIVRAAVAARQGTTLPADTAKNAAYTHTVPANTLGTNKVLEFHFILRKTSGANSVTFGAEWNGSAMHSALSVTTLNCEIFITLYGDGTTSAQRSTVCTETYSAGTITRTKTITTYAHDQTVDRNLVVYVTKTVGADVVTLDLVKITEFRP